MIFTPEFGGVPIQGFPAVVSNKLGGYLVNVYQGMTPEYWYLK